MSEPLPVPLVPAASRHQFTRRSLLAAVLAGTALLAAGCTGSDGDDADAVTPAQVDQLAAQVQVQEALVAAFAQAFTAAPELATTAAVLADQAQEQLDRLRAAAPESAGTSSAAGTPAGAPVVDAAGARSYLLTQVVTAADAHAAACPEFSGGRAALLGSIAAGLRGQTGQLA